MTQNDNTPATQTLAAALIDMTHRGALIQAACLAAELGLADHLADGPKQAADLARMTGSHPPSLVWSWAVRQTGTLRRVRLP